MKKEIIKLDKIDIMFLKIKIGTLKNIMRVEFKYCYKCKTVGPHEDGCKMCKRKIYYE